MTSHEYATNGQRITAEMIRELNERYTKRYLDSDNSWDRTPFLRGMHRTIRRRQLEGRSPGISNAVGRVKETLLQGENAKPLADTGSLYGNAQAVLLSPDRLVVWRHTTDNGGSVYVCECDDRGGYDVHMMPVRIRTGNHTESPHNAKVHLLPLTDEGDIRLSRPDRDQLADLSVILGHDADMSTFITNAQN